MTLRYIGSATTNKDGIAILNYTGTGRGKLNINATCDTLETDTYTFEDCIFYDPVKNDTNGKYYIQSTNGTTLTYDNNMLTLTGGTNTNQHYVDLRSIANLVRGETVNFSVDTILKGISARLEVRAGTTTSSMPIVKNSTYTTEDGTITLHDIKIPDKPYIVFRINPRYTSPGDTYLFKNWKITFTEGDE